MKKITRIAIILLAIHTIEEVATFIWQTDPLALSLSKLTGFSPAVFYWLGQLILFSFLFIFYLVKNKKILHWMYSIIGLILLFEFYHPITSLNAGMYTSGLYTGIILSIFSIYFWLVYLKKNVYAKNIFANILGLICGYVGMQILVSLGQYFGWVNFILPVWIPLVVIGIGLVVRIWASIHFSKNNVDILNMNTHPALVASGPYCYSRNPLYIGILLITLGFVLLAGSYVGLLLTILFFITFNYVIGKKEEPELLKEFGDGYKNYKLKVNRWI